MPDEVTTRSVLVGPASNETRRALGPTSWVVLEELLLQSADTKGEYVARASVRSLAESLGLAKDTVARAVCRLRDSGLVTVAQQRTNTGIFATSTYFIVLPDGISVSVPAIVAPQSCARVGRRDSSQLSLAIEP